MTFTVEWFDCNIGLILFIAEQYKFNLHVGRFGY